MKSILIGMLTLMLALPAVAERKHSVGEHDVHYSAFKSSFLQPDIAAAAGLVVLRERRLDSVRLRRLVREAGLVARG